MDRVPASPSAAVSAEARIVEYRTPMGVKIRGGAASYTGTYCLIHLKGVGNTKPKGGMGHEEVVAARVQHRASDPDPMGSGGGRFAHFRVLTNSRLRGRGRPDSSFVRLL